MPSYKDPGVRQVSFNAYLPHGDAQLALPNTHVAAFDSSSWAPFRAYRFAQITTFGIGAGTRTYKYRPSIPS